MREIVAIAIPLLCVASLHISRVPQYSALKAIGLAGECSLDDALAIDQHRREFNSRRQQIQNTSRIDQIDKQAGIVRWQTPHGAFWAPFGTDVPFLLSEQMGGFYGSGQRRVRPGDTVLDCGANIGTFVWEALAAGAGRVIAIEPSVRNIECLRRNYAKEIADGRVTIYPKGVWDKDETLRFFVYDNSALDSIVMSVRPEEKKKAREVQIPVTTIDRIVDELQLAKVDFIKMDIEGAERNAVRGSRETLLKFRPRLSIATENLPDDPAVVPALIQSIRPEYKRECGHCVLRSQIEISPDVYYFF